MSCFLLIIYLFMNEPLLCAPLRFTTCVKLRVKLMRNLFDAIHESATNHGMLEMLLVAAQSSNFGFLQAFTHSKNSKIIAMCIFVQNLIRLQSIFR